LQAAVRKTIVLVTHDLDEAVRLGDRIAVLSEGGHLQQYSPPAELLGQPADDFVRKFVGADRGIKRLAVTPIPRAGLKPMSSVDGTAGPSVPVSGTMRDALAALLEGGQGWVAVRDSSGEPLGVLTPTEIALAASDPAGDPASDPAE
jgi:osmoprotectant transport system ATP-binding protein